MDSALTTELQTINHIRDILDLPILPVLETYHFQSPVFHKHGSEDVKVAVNLEQYIVNFLQRIDLVYEAFDVWYQAPDEIDDIAPVSREKIGVHVPKDLDIALKLPKNPSPRIFAYVKLATWMTEFVELNCLYHPLPCCTLPHKKEKKRPRTNVGQVGVRLP
ncbi:hypothetical protein ACJ72_05373 [Emergomyces africanus]|uniref:Uncharacterized protein n=1 Tax=Emergomyces africanus TaxID=1955775 RepID=A0A1B7NU60_9EURO|nr:hypothetical protein ACJ72_05373 [Emergomyces africanus]